ncbi:distal membrane-arm assembly complex protein 2 isoform X1 [Cricetulus griseus]|uniref:distal membrane-arm assembly complex protein 2 isoform X1 n=1 Tax=Cricetulus griseus TaxID=10029 RepID=UPI0015C3D01C|nr:distal membrane-arm assembly complex protein 2 isoform X1 [Cricetulus griseus]
MAAPREFLRLGAREWNGRARAIHGPREPVTPDSNQKRICSPETRQAAPGPRLHLTYFRFLHRSFPNIQQKYGPDVTGALFILKQGGAVKYDRCCEGVWGGAALLAKGVKTGRSLGRSGWPASLTNKLWFLTFREVPVEAVDASGCAINYQGMSNLLPLKELRSLSLQQRTASWCCFLRIWTETPCHSPICPHPFRNLRRLDISDLPAVSHPGLTQILVEEMLPHCEVFGTDWALGPKLEPLQGSLANAKELADHPEMTSPGL